MSTRNLLSTATVNLRTLFANGKRYEVPPYQRDYAWNEENWEDLWLDLEEIERSGRQHYMGALVLQETEADRFRIIDGQQRMATLSLLAVAALHCLQAFAVGGAEPDDNRQRIEVLRRTFLGSEDPISLRTVPKLTLNEANRRFFEGTILELRTPASVSALRSFERPLWDALQYFRKRLDERYGVAKDGASLAKFLYETVATQLLFIHVLVDDELGAYTVFETLNARGLELSASDLLKNYLFSLIHPTGDSNLHRAQGLWHSTADRVPARRIPEFLRHYLNSMHALVRHDRVYKTIRTEVTRPEHAFELLEKLEVLALLNEALDDPHHTFWHEYPGAKDHVRHLNLYGVVQFRPLVFAAWLPFPRDDFIKLLRIIDIISFRYNVIGQLHPSRLEHAYNKAALDVRSGALATPAAVRDALKAVYPDDDEFRETFAKRSISASGGRAKLVRYILCALEKQAHGIDMDDETTPATIEHVLPQNPSPEWLLEFSGDLHERYIDRLGNYLLLEPKLNKKNAGNLPLSEKKPCYAESQYPSASNFEWEAWNPSIIDSRQSRMAKQATAIWRL